MNNLATRIIELTPEGISSYDGNYDAYLDFKNMSVRKEVAAVAKAQVKNVKESTLSKKELFELRKKYKNLENNMNKYKAELEALVANMYQFSFGTPEYNQAQEKKDVLEKRIAKSETELINFPHADELEL